MPSHVVVEWEADKMTNPTEQAQVERIEGWRDDLEELNTRIAPRFARPEVRARVGRYLFGLLGALERKNGWRMAEHLGESTPTACSGCLTPLVGTRTRCATTCALTWLSTSEIRGRSW